MPESPEEIRGWGFHIIVPSFIPDFLPLSGPAVTGFRIFHLSGNGILIISQDLRFIVSRMRIFAFCPVLNTEVCAVCGGDGRTSAS